MGEIEKTETDYIFGHSGLPVALLLKRTRLMFDEMGAPVFGPEKLAEIKEAETFRVTGTLSYHYFINAKYPVNEIPFPQLPFDYEDSGTLGLFIVNAIAYGSSRMAHLSWYYPDGRLFEAIWVWQIGSLATDFFRQTPRLFNYTILLNLCSETWLTEQMFAPYPGYEILSDVMHQFRKEARGEKS